MGTIELTVASGDLLWWAPGQDHVLLDASPDFDLFVIGVTPDFSLRVLSHDVPVGPARIRLSREILSAFSEICTSVGHVRDVVAVERGVGDVWQKAHQLRPGNEFMHTLTRRTLRSLVVAPELRRDAVARRIRAYPTELSRHFHADMGLTLAAYRTRLRLLRFIDIVDGGADNLLAAALQAGFGSYSQCHRSFQRTLGCTPRAFFSTELRAEMQESVTPLSPETGTQCEFAIGG
jgi:AraC-like DNA-binding protein